MGSVHGKHGLEEIHSSYMERPPSVVNDIKSRKMGNPRSRAGFKFVTVPASKAVMADARKQLLTMSEEKSRKILDGTLRIDKSQGEFVGRAGLTYQPEHTNRQETTGKKGFARSYVNEMTKEAVFTDRKRNELNKIWPQIFYEMVYSALSDMADSQTYMKKCMEEIDKT